MSRSEVLGSGRRIWQELELFRVKNSSTIRAVLAMDAYDIMVANPTNTVMPPFSPAVETIFKGLTLLAYAHPLFAHIVAQSQWVISIHDNSCSDVKVPCARKHLLSMLCGLFRFATPKDVLSWTEGRNSGLYGRLQSWVQTVEDDIKQYESDLFHYMNCDASEADVFRVKTAEFRLNRYSTTFTLRQIELEDIVTSETVLEIQAVIPTIIFEDAITEEDASVDRLLLNTSALSGDDVPRSDKTRGDLHSDSTFEYHSTIPTETARSSNASPFVIELTASHDGPAIEPFKLHPNLINNRPGSIDSFLSASSDSHATCYSEASSRTVSTDYGIYFRRLAISQETLESGSCPH